MANYKPLGTAFDRTFRNDLNENFGTIDGVASEAKTKADQAVVDSADAKTVAEEAKTKSDSTQAQLDQVVIDGDSSVEAAQARVNAEGVAKATLKERLDEDYNKVTTELAETLIKADDASVKANDAIGKASNPISNMETSGQKVTMSLLAPDVQTAIAGTSTLTTGVGIEKNKGVDYPLKAMTRDGVMSNSDTKIKNGILDIKIRGAKQGKYYRLEWLGNGVALNGGNRYDVLLSEYDKSTYATSSASGAINLITLADLLGFNNPPLNNPNIVTRLFESPRDSISIEITYDSSVIGGSFALNNNLGNGYSFIIDETCYEYSQQALNVLRPSMYVRKNGDDITLAWKYNSTKDIRIHLERFSANRLMLMGRIGFVDNTQQYVSKDFGLTEQEFTPKLTDWISPYMMAAVANADGDRANNTYEFVGGCHNYANTATESATATARLVGYELFIDGILTTQNGIYPAKDVKLVANNRIQANNTKKTDGTGREVLGERVTYNIKAGEISVENQMTALEEVNITRNYGLQAYIWGFVLSGGTVHYVDGKDYNWYALEADSNSGTKAEGSDCVKMIVKDASHMLELEMHNIGLVKKRKINDTVKQAFYTGNKLYNYLIDNTFNLKAGNTCYYSGKYRFSSL